MKYFNVAIQNHNKESESYLVWAETSVKALIRAKSEWDKTHNVSEPVLYQWTATAGPANTPVSNTEQVIKPLCAPKVHSKPTPAPAVTTLKEEQKEDQPLPLQKPIPLHTPELAPLGTFFCVNGHRIEMSLEPMSENDNYKN